VAFVVRRILAILVVLAGLVIPGAAVTAAAPVSAQTACTTSQVNGPNQNCGPYSDPNINAGSGWNTYVGIDGWACGDASVNPNGTCLPGPTTLTAPDPAASPSVTTPFSLTTTLAPAAGNGVQMYPSVGQNYGSTLVSAMKSYQSGFSETMPHDQYLIAHAAYDLFLDNSGQSNEVMIDFDNVNWGPCCGQFLGKASFWGLTYTAQRFGTEIVWYLDSDNSQLSSVPTVHLKSMLMWLETHNLPGTATPDLAATTTLGISGFGWEIRSTGGEYGSGLTPQTETMTVNSFWMHSDPTDCGC